MGLDGVELVMKVEDEFGISIPDADAEQIVSVGSLYVYLCSRLSHPIDARPRRCLSRATFLRLRDALTSVPSFDRRKFRPSERIAIAVSPDEVERHRSQLEKTIGLRLPRFFDPPVWRMCAVVLVGVAVSVEVTPAAGPLAAVLVALLFAMFRARSSPADVDFRRLVRRSVTVREWVQAIHGASGLSGDGTWQPEGIWRLLQRIIAEQFGVPPEMVTPDKDFIRDLGM